MPAVRTEWGRGGASTQCYGGTFTTDFAVRELFRPISNMSNASPCNTTRQGNPSERSVAPVDKQWRPGHE